MSRPRARLAAIVVAVLVGAAVFAVTPNLGAVARARSVGSAVKASSPAQAPFRGLTATTVHLGTRALQVVVAKTDSQRQRGLRRRSDLGRYDGMLFVFSADTTVGFTMSTVPVSLDIGFYRADGRPVGTLRMVPCAGTDATCPVYQAPRAFRYTVETLVGGLPAGTLSG